MMTVLVNSTFSPDDVDVLRCALDAWCAEKHVSIQSAEAQSAASAIIDLFQSGKNTRETLLVAMRAQQGT